MRIVTAALLGSVALLATETIAKDVSYMGSVETVQGAEPADAAGGTVFLDENRNSVLDEDEAGVPGVLVRMGEGWSPRMMPADTSCQPMTI